MTWLRPSCTLLATGFELLAYYFVPRLFVSVRILWPRRFVVLFGPRVYILYVCVFPRFLDTAAHSFRIAACVVASHPTCLLFGVCFHQWYFNLDVFRLALLLHIIFTSFEVSRCVSFRFHFPGWYGLNSVYALSRACVLSVHISFRSLFSYAFLRYAFIWWVGSPMSLVVVNYGTGLFTRIINFSVWPVSSNFWQTPAFASSRGSVCHEWWLFPADKYVVS